MARSAVIGTSWTGYRRTRVKLDGDYTRVSRAVPNTRALSAAAHRCFPGNPAGALANPGKGSRDTGPGRGSGYPHRGLPSAACAGRNPCCRRGRNTRCRYCAGVDRSPARGIVSCHCPVLESSVRTRRGSHTDPVPGRSGVPPRTCIGGCLRHRQAPPARVRCCPWNAGKSAGAFKPLLSRTRSDKGFRVRQAGLRPLSEASDVLPASIPRFREADTAQQGPAACWGCTSNGGEPL